MDHTYFHFLGTRWEPYGAVSTRTSFTWGAGGITVPSCMGYRCTLIGFLKHVSRLLVLASEEICPIHTLPHPPFYLHSFEYHLDHRFSDCQKCSMHLRNGPRAISHNDTVTGATHWRGFRRSRVLSYLSTGPPVHVTTLSPV